MLACGSTQIAAAQAFRPARLPTHVAFRNRVTNLRRHATVATARCALLPTNERRQGAAGAGWNVMGI
jgi:hypothetical protein